jgi:hypothetical protein
MSIMASLVTSLPVALGKSRPIGSPLVGPCPVGLVPSRQVGCSPDGSSRGLLVWSCRIVSGRITSGLGKSGQVSLV